MEKHCAKCGVPCECLAPSPECWCKTITPFQPICEEAVKQYGGFVCKTCSSFMFYTPEQLHTAWGLGRTG